MTTMTIWSDSYSVDGALFCGNFFDHVRLANGGYGLIVGDIAGRGIDAATAASTLCSRVRDLVLGPLPLTTTIRVASGVFTRTMMKERTPFASLFIAMIDSSGTSVRYLSAGHEPALLLRGDGTHEHLEPTGPVLGTGTITAYRESVVATNPDEVLIIVTDGVTEARHEDGDRLQFFGSTGVVRSATRALRSGADPARAICAAAREHAQGRLTDDACAVVSRLEALPIAAPFRQSRVPPYDLRMGTSPGRAP
jgi:phosphoserine phosphatase RsbU/P